MPCCPTTAEHSLEFFTWGLIPSWAKDPTIGNRMINARAETLAEKPAFRPPSADALPDPRRRLLRVAQADSGKRKPPHVHPPGGRRALRLRRPVGDAGSPGWLGRCARCTIITTEPNALDGRIHDRMPVILPETAYPLWLQQGEADPKDSLRSSGALSR